MATNKDIVIGLLDEIKGFDDEYNSRCDKIRDDLIRICNENPELKEVVMIYCCKNIDDSNYYNLYEDFVRGTHFPLEHTIKILENVAQCIYLRPEDIGTTRCHHEIGIKNTQTAMVELAEYYNPVFHPENSNIEKQLFWLHKAAEHGHNRAFEGLALHHLKLNTKEDIDIAEKYALEYLDRGYLDPDLFRFVSEHRGGLPMTTEMKHHIFEVCAKHMCKYNYVKKYMDSFVDALSRMNIENEFIQYIIEKNNKYEKDINLGKVATMMNGFIGGTSPINLIDGNMCREIAMHVVN